MSENNFQTLNEKAKLIVSSGNWSLALEAYTNILSLKKLTAAEKAITYSNCSLMYLNLKSFPLALKDALSAIKENPNWFKGYLRAGDAYLQANLIKKCLENYKSGFGKEGDDGSLQKKYGQVYFSKVFKTRLDPTKKFQLWEDFKACYFTDFPKAMKIYNLVQETKKKSPNLEFECIYHEIHRVLLDNMNAEDTIELFMKGLIYEGSLCVWNIYLREDSSCPPDSFINTFLDSYRKKAKKSPIKTIQYVLKNTVPPIKNFSIDFKKIIDIFWPHLHENLYLSKMNSTLYYYVEAIQDDGNEWILNQGAKIGTPKDFFPAGGPEKSQYCYWKFFTMNTCGFINSCLAAVIQELIDSGIVPYFKFLNKETGKEEEVSIVCSTVSELIVRKKYTNPWMYYKNYNAWFPMLRGRKVSIPFELNFGFGHTVAFFLTNKEVKSQNLNFLVDLTGFQYDFLSTTERGYPYFEEQVLSGEEFNENFVFQNDVELIAKLGISKWDHVGSFPTSSWKIIKDSTIKEVRKLLKI